MDLFTKIKAMNSFTESEQHLLILYLIILTMSFN